MKPGSSVSFTIGVHNSNSPACPAPTWKLSSAQPASLSGQLSVTSLTVNSGADATATLKETSGKVAGKFSVSVTATSAIYAGSANATVVVGSATTTARLR
jgi:hypothetical protein